MTLTKISICYCENTTTPRTCETQNRRIAYIKWSAYFNVKYYNLLIASATTFLFPLMKCGTKSTHCKRNDQRASLGLC